MSRRPAPIVRSQLPDVLRRRGMSWGELGRRTLLAPPVLGRLRDPAANPRLAVAERIAAALGVPVERLWRLVVRR